LSSSASFFTIAAIQNRIVYPETSELLLYFIASVLIAVSPEEYPCSFGFRAYRFIMLRTLSYFASM
jgi:hypothetical protein